MTTPATLTDWAEISACSGHARHPYISAELLNSTELAVVVANIGFGRGITIEQEGPVPSCYRIFPNDPPDVSTTNPSPPPPPSRPPTRPVNTSRSPAVTLPLTPQVSVPNTASIRTQGVRTNRAARFATLGWSRSALQTLVPFSGDIRSEFVGGESIPSVDAQGTTLVSRHCFPTGLIRINTRKLDLQKDVNKTFVDEVKAAIKSGTDAEKTTKLREVFAQWGHVVATWVEVGGAKVAQTTLTANNTRTAVEAALDTLVNTSSGSVAPADAGRFVLTTVGGNFFSRDNNAWKTALLDYHVWNIISVLEVVPTYTFLPDATDRQEVARLIGVMRAPSGPAFTVSPKNFVLQSTGSSRRMPIPDNVLNGSFTISHHFRTPTAVSPNTSFLSLMADRFPDSLMVIGPWSSTHMQIWFTTGTPQGTGERITFNYMLALNTWVHLTFIWDRTQDVITLYLDGRSVASQAIQQAWREHIEGYRRMSLILGRWWWNRQESTPCAVEIENIQIWDRALTAAEIQPLVPRV